MHFSSEPPLNTEIAALRGFVTLDPENPLYLLKLARKLAFGDLHNEALAVAIEGRERFPQVPGFAAVEGECANALGDPERARRVLAAMPESTSPRTFAQALHELGTAEEELGLLDLAERSYERALEVDPHAPRPCKALHQLLRSKGAFGAILENCDRLEQAGVGHSRIHADRMVALALSGRKDEALELFAFDRFSRFMDISADIDETAWPNLSAFNDALVVELESDPNRQFGRRMTASRNSWRLQQPFSGFGKPALAELRGIIARSVERHATVIGQDSHFFARAASSKLSCVSWAICAPGQGFEDWHVHPGAWLVGVYYIRVPKTGIAPDSKGGSITFGLPDYDGMPQAGEDWQTVRPRDGMLALFPGHCFHRTWPTGSPEGRWIVACDFLPLRD